MIKYTKITDTELTMKIIARIICDYKEKFGIPRQSGIADAAIGRIVFEREYRNPDALRGIEGYSHLWLIWQFSECVSEEFSPTVRPPRLGGNTRIGVFASRAPYRPNPIGLSSVRLLGIEHSDTLGDVLLVAGADLMNGTPIYDIKPYLAYTDSHPDATGGFSDAVREYSLPVNVSEALLSMVEPDKRETLISILRHDPRPSYKNDGEREYGFLFADYEVFFKVCDGTLTVTKILNAK